MYLQVNGHSTYCYTGGKDFDPAKPTAVFIHGVLNDHSVWGLQTRYFANHGWNVLAVDLPGQSRSVGPPPKSVEEGAQFLLALLDAAGLAKAAFVGHSFGSLIALEAASKAPDRVSHLCLAGTACPMKVTPALLQGALDHPFETIDLVVTFSHSNMAPPPSTLGPGTWLHGSSRALMRRVLASNQQVNLFHTGFKACDDYAGGLEAIDRVKCPVLFLLGKSDFMTLAKTAQPLQARVPGARTVLLQGGHQMMTEAPDAMLSALKDFLKP